MATAGLGRVVRGRAADRGILAMALDALPRAPVAPRSVDNGRRTSMCQYGGHANTDPVCWGDALECRSRGGKPGRAGESRCSPRRAPCPPFHHAHLREAGVRRCLRPGSRRGINPGRVGPGSSRVGSRPRRQLRDGLGADGRNGRGPRLRVLLRRPIALLRALRPGWRHVGDPGATDDRSSSAIRARAVGRRRLGRAHPRGTCGGRDLPRGNPGFHHSRLENGAPAANLCVYDLFTSRKVGAATAVDSERPALQRIRLRATYCAACVAFVDVAPGKPATSCPRCRLASAMRCRPARSRLTRSPPTSTRCTSCPW